MKYLEFIELAKESTKRTQNVRVCTEPVEIWSICSEFENILRKVDLIVALIQTEIDKGLFCKKDEYLLLYDLEPLSYRQADLYRIIAVIKPQLEIDETLIIKGKPFELIFNVATDELTHIQNSHSFQVDSCVAREGFSEHSLLFRETLSSHTTVKKLMDIRREFETISLNKDATNSWLSKQKKRLSSNSLTFRLNLNSDFSVRLYANMLPNIRVCTKSSRVNGVYHAPYHVLEKIEYIIGFIQSRINKGDFCKKNQFLLLYNFQPLQADNSCFYSIDMMVKPILKIFETDIIKGQPLQLVVNVITGEVMNNTKCLIELGLGSQSQVSKQRLDPPKSYGSYHQYEKNIDAAKLIKSKSQPKLAGIIQSRKINGAQSEPSKEKEKALPKLPLTFSVPLNLSLPIQKNLCILIVEDNMINQKVLSNVLSRAGFLHYYVVNNGKEAVEFYIKMSIDIILMDVEMPVMNGLEATKIIRELERQPSRADNRTTIIGLSGNTNKQDIDKALQFGMDGYLTKPCKKDALLQTIQHYMYMKDDLQRGRGNYCN